MTDNIKTSSIRKLYIDAFGHDLDAVTNEKATGLKVVELAKWLQAQTNNKWTLLPLEFGKEAIKYIESHKDCWHCTHVAHSFDTKKWNLKLLEEYL